jgi:hypothetical protein
MSETVPSWRRHVSIATAITLALPLTSCLGPMPVPMDSLNRKLAQQGSLREPSLSGPWLALITNRSGRDQVELVDVNRQRPVPLPGLNRPDAQPLSVSVSGGGDRLVVVRQVEGRTELVLYRRGLMSSERIAMVPIGVPRRAVLRADGREIAVEVSRQGRTQVDLISLP